MIERILVCLEGSPCTESATAIAVALARGQGAQLLGIAVVDEPDIRAGTPTSIGGASFKHDRDEELMATARRRADDCRALFERHCREAGIEARTVEGVGRPADCILAEMQNHDLAILGREANFRFETDAADAETCAEILQKSRGPVLLVPEHASEIGPKVLICFDGGDAATRAAVAFADSGFAAGRQVHVATVDDNGERAWEMAKRAVDLLAAKGVASDLHNVVSALPTVDALLRLSEEIGAGLIVMGAYARSRFATLFAGSVTRSLIAMSNVSIYLQR